MRNKGITLVALVVTIVIMLILVGVTLNIALSDNGILSKAEKTKEIYETTSEKEKRQISMSEAAMNFENTQYKDINGDKAIIPAGFAVSQVEGENVINNGLVIIDSNGNEFVWIPVENVEKDYVRNTNYIDYDIARADRDYLPDDLTYGQSGTEEEIEKKIIQKSGGFYVGRYEAGVDGDISISTVERKSALFMERKPISSL